MNYGRAIKTIRAAKGVSQQQLSNLASLDRSYVSRIEGGDRVPTVETLESIAKALSVPFYLLVLLSSESQDIKSLPASETQEIAHQLLDTLISVQSGPVRNAR